MNANPVTEQAITFDCDGDALVGILHVPAAPCDVGVVVIVGGPQYRAGSHRQFVLLARELAAAGYAVLRFDCRGMGDSGGATHRFEAVGADIAAALVALQFAVPSVQRIALWGLCDGASAALLYVGATRDPRVTGMCLLNPWVRSTASLARAHLKHHYAQRLRKRDFWAKLLRGRIGTQALRGFIGSLRARHAVEMAATSFQQRMARAWATFGGQILLVLSGNDVTAKEFVEFTQHDVAWTQVFLHPRTQRHEVATADHTFSSDLWRNHVNEHSLRWLRGLAVARPVAQQETT